MNRNTARCLLLLPLLTGLLVSCGGDAPTQISASGFGAFEPAVAVLGDTLAVAWNDNRHGNDEIFLRILDADLNPLSDELRLTDEPALSYEAALANFGGNLAVAWYDREPSGRLVTKLGLWTPQGEALWQHTVSAPERSGRIPVLQTSGDKLFIAWVEQSLPDAAEDASSLRGAWLDAGGEWLVPSFEVAKVSRTTWNLNADALSDGRIVLVFDAETTTRSSELYLALIGAAGRAIVMPLSEDDGFASKYPDIAVGERIALTWFDMKDGNEEVYLALFDTFASNLLNNALRVTETAGESTGAYVAWNGATVGLAWNDNDSGQHEVHFQAFDAAAQALGGARRLTTTDAQSLIPAIVAHRGGFVLAWNEVVLGGGGHEGDMGATRSEIAVTTAE